MIKKKDLTQEDKNAWENYIKNPSDIYDKDKDLAIDKKRKDRFEFDLHGFSLESANKKIHELLQYCIELLIITGKGIHSTNDQDVFSSKDLGKLKYSIPDYIKSNDELRNFVISINNAKKKDGGEGALILKLKKL